LHTSVSQTELSDLAFLDVTDDPMQAGYYAKDAIFKEQGIRVYSRNAAIGQVKFVTDKEIANIKQLPPDSGVEIKTNRTREVPLLKADFQDGFYSNGVYQDWVQRIWQGNVYTKLTQDDNQTQVFELTVNQTPLNYGLSASSVRVAPFNTIILSGIAKCENGIRAGLEIQFYDVNGQRISEISTRIPQDSRWSDVIVSAIPPEGALFAVPRWRVFEAAQSGLKVEFGPISLRGIPNYLEKFVVNFPTQQKWPINGTASGYSLGFQFSTLTKQNVSIVVNGQKYQQVIEPGVSCYETPPVALPARVNVSSESADPLYLQWVQLRSASNQRASLIEPDTYLITNFVSTSSSQTINSTLNWIGPRRDTEPGWLELRMSLADDPDSTQIVGTWAIDGTRQSASVEVQMEDGTMRLSPTNDSGGPLSWTPNKGDGQYIAEIRGHFADASIPSQGGHVQDDGSWTEVFRFTMQGGKVVATELNDEGFKTTYVSTDTWHNVDAKFGDFARLRGYNLDSDIFRTGRNANLSLFWDVPKGFARDWNISLQLVDAQGKVWSEKIGDLKDAVSFQDSWSETETLRKDFALPVGRDVPEGQYNLRVQMYYSFSADTLPVRGSGGEPSNALLLGPYSVKIPLYLQNR
jgi:hypothetical protein